MRDQSSSGRRNAESRHLCDLYRRLPDDRRIQRPARRLDRALELSFLRRITNIGALFTEFLKDGILHCFVADNRLLGGTKRAIVEALSSQDVSNRFGDVGSL